MTSEKADDFENNADQYWNKFYSVHQEKYVIIRVVNKLKRQNILPALKEKLFL